MQEKKKQLEPDMEKMDWFQIGKGTCQGCILSPCLFNLYAEYFMWNARLDESQAGINTDRRDNNNMGTENFQMYKLDLEKAEEPEV